MSLPPSQEFQLPEDIKLAAHAAFPRGNRLLRLRDELGDVFTNQDFADLYPVRGQPALHPWRLALVTILQFLDNLSDRDAADAVSARLDWKYLLGLGVQDPGFHYSVLCRFRKRLIEGNAEHVLLQKLLEACRNRGLLKSKGQVRTDATHVLACVRRVNRVELVGETLRFCLNHLATLAPTWLASWVPDDWFKHYSHRFEQGRQPRGSVQERKLVERIGQDGRLLYERASREDAPRGVASSHALEVLRQCWLHNFFVEDDEIRWREAGTLAPSSLRIDSPYDLDAHYGSKGEGFWVGYKVHLTETCDEDLPHLVTMVETTPAFENDIHRTQRVHAELKKADLVPEKHFVDAAYLDSGLIVSSQENFEIQLIGPVKRTSKNKLQRDRFDISQFKVDWEKRVVLCPQGKESIDFRQDVYRGEERFLVTWSRKECKACPVASMCTKNKQSNPRRLTLRPQKLHEVLHNARITQETQEWQQEYAIRQGIEATFSQGVRSLGLRRSRYIGRKRNHLQNVAISAAINLERLSEWFAGRPRAETRVSRFERLRPSA